MFRCHASNFSTYKVALPGNYSSLRVCGQVYHFWSMGPYIHLLCCKRDPLHCNEGKIKVLLCCLLHLMLLSGGICATLGAITTSYVLMLVLLLNLKMLFRCMEGNLLKTGRNRQISKTDFCLLHPKIQTQEHTVLWQLPVVLYQETLW